MSETNLTEQERAGIEPLREHLASGKAMMYTASVAVNLLAIIDRLDAELTRLTERLPRTADGVTIVPGMEVWVRVTNDGGKTRSVRKHMVSRVHEFAGGVSFKSTPALSVCTEIGENHIYSTYEAAREAAERSER